MENENAPNLFDNSGVSNRFSNEQNIIISTVLPASPNSLDIAWETNDGIPATSLTLHYRIVGTNEFQIATAMIDAKEFTINDLRAHSEYEVFASVPHGLSGFISNIRKGKYSQHFSSSHRFCIYRLQHYLRRQNIGWATVFTTD